MPTYSLWVVTSSCFYYYGIDWGYYKMSVDRIALYGGTNDRYRALYCLCGEMAKHWLYLHWYKYLLKRKGLVEIYQGVN